MDVSYTTNPVLFGQNARQGISSSGLFFAAIPHSVLPLDVPSRCGLSAGILIRRTTALFAERSPKQLGPARLKSGGHIILGGRAHIVRFQGGPEAGFRTAKVPTAADSISQPGQGPDFEQPAAEIELK